MGSKICSQLICILSAHFQLGFSSKLKCPSSARLGDFSARARSSRKIPARTHHYYILTLVCNRDLIIDLYFVKTLQEIKNKKVLQKRSSFFEIFSGFFFCFTFFPIQFCQIGLVKTSFSHVIHFCFYERKKRCIFQPSLASLGQCRSQIREQMYGPDLHVLTPKFLALNKNWFSPMKNTFHFFFYFC